ncbi:MAG: hypothetical protein U9Q21_01195, partial [Candidatus Auribacterota bacterium]|nr:hypothetical protein [Candidatus Auribacterota bacterium]
QPLASSKSQKKLSGLIGASGGVQAEQSAKQQESDRRRKEFEKKRKEELQAGVGQEKPREHVFTSAVTGYSYKGENGKKSGDVGRNLDKSVEALKTTEDGAEEIIQAAYGNKFYKNPEQGEFLSKNYPRAKDLIKKWRKKNPGEPIRIICEGPTGAGKSTVVPMDLAREMPELLGTKEEGLKDKGLIVFDTAGGFVKNIPVIVEGFKNMGIKGKVGRWDEGLSHNKKLQLIRESRVLCITPEQAKAIDLAVEKKPSSQKDFLKYQEGQQIIDALRKKMRMILVAEKLNLDTSLISGDKQIQVGKAAKSGELEDVDTVLRHISEVVDSISIDESGNPIFSKEMLKKIAKENKVSDMGHLRGEKGGLSAAYDVVKNLMAEMDFAPMVGGGGVRIVDAEGLGQKDLVSPSVLEAMAKQKITSKAFNKITGKELRITKGTVSKDSTSERAQVEDLFKRLETNGEDGVQVLLEMTGDSLEGAAGDRLVAETGTLIVRREGTGAGKKKTTSELAKNKTNEGHDRINLRDKNGKAYDLYGEDGNLKPLHEVLPGFSGAIKKGRMTIIEALGYVIKNGRMYNYQTLLESARFTVEQLNLGADIKTQRKKLQKELEAKISELKRDADGLSPEEINRAIKEVKELGEAALKNLKKQPGMVFRDQFDAEIAWEVIDPSKPVYSYSEGEGGIRNAIFRGTLNALSLKGLPATLRKWAENKRLNKNNLKKVFIEEFESKMEGVEYDRTLVLLPKAYTRAITHYARHYDGAKDSFFIVCNDDSVGSLIAQSWERVRAPMVKDVWGPDGVQKARGFDFLKQAKETFNKQVVVLATEAKNKNEWLNLVEGRNQQRFDRKILTDKTSEKISKTYNILLNRIIEKAENEKEKAILEEMKQAVNKHDDRARNSLTPPTKSAAEGFNDQVEGFRNAIKGFFNTKKGVKAYSELSKPVRGVVDNIIRGEREYDLRVKFRKEGEARDLEGISVRDAVYTGSLEKLGQALSKRNLETDFLKIYPGLPKGHELVSQTVSNRFTGEGKFAGSRVGKYIFEKGRKLVDSEFVKEGWKYGAGRHISPVMGKVIGWVRGETILMTYIANHEDGPKVTKYTNFDNNKTVNFVGIELAPGQYINLDTQVIYNKDEDEAKAQQFAMAQRLPSMPEREIDEALTVVGYSKQEIKETIRAVHRFKEKPESSGIFKNMQPVSEMIEAAPQDVRALSRLMNPMAIEMLSQFKGGSVAAGHQIIVQQYAAVQRLMEMQEDEIREALKGVVSGREKINKAGEAVTNLRKELKITGLTIKDIE